MSWNTSLLPYPAETGRPGYSWTRKSFLLEKFLNPQSFNSNKNILLQNHT